MARMKEPDARSPQDRCADGLISPAVAAKRAAASARTASREIPAHRFDIFLSHNRLDQPTVGRLASKLREAGLEPWLDHWYLTGGGVWQEDLAAALRDSATCAVCVGPHGFGDWAREELLVAQD